MKATVYYVQLTDAQINELNRDPAGWDSGIGRRYMAAREGKIDLSNRDLVRRAATIEADSAEEIWVALQNNSAAGWRSRPGIKCLIDFPRSMDVGDFVLWEDGRLERCASCGFEPASYQVTFP